MLFDSIILAIFILKITFLLLLARYSYLMHYRPHDPQLKHVEYYKDRTEFVFMLSVSILILYRFGTFLYSGETMLEMPLKHEKILYFAYAIVEMASLLRSRKNM